MRLRPTSAIAASFAIATIVSSCGNSGTEPRAAATSTATAAPTSTNSTTTPSVLTAKDTCLAFWDHDVDIEESLAFRSMQPLVSIAKDPSGASINEAELRSLVNEMRDFERKAAPETEAYLAKMRGPLAELLDVFYTGRNRNIASGDVREANMEFLGYCADNFPGLLADQ